MERNYGGLCRYWQEIAAYPDIFLDTIRSSERPFNFYPY